MAVRKSLGARGLSGSAFSKNKPGVVEQAGLIRITDLTGGEVSDSAADRKVLLVFGGVLSVIQGMK